MQYAYIIITYMQDGGDSTNLKSITKLYLGIAGEIHPFSGHCLPMLQTKTEEIWRGYQDTRSHELQTYGERIQEEV